MSDQRAEDIQDIEKKLSNIKAQIVPWDMGDLENEAWYAPENADVVKKNEEAACLLATLMEYLEAMETDHLIDEDDGLARGYYEAAILSNFYSGAIQNADGALDVYKMRFEGSVLSQPLQDIDKSFQDEFIDQETLAQEQDGYTM